MCVSLRIIRAVDLQGGFCIFFERSVIGTELVLWIDRRESPMDRRIKLPEEWDKIFELTIILLTSTGQNYMIYKKHSLLPVQGSFSNHDRSGPERKSANMPPSKADFNMDELGGFRPRCRHHLKGERISGHSDFQSPAGI
ncbi:hypothetical protein [Staphylospora marina]|uniref:hypothetical protein n=1 Tax=Staphylospora marina TaxID=2490858 RepID=UPI000F5BE70F|nr:hypothetical protein [Staphylospora marina]